MASLAFLNVPQILDEVHAGAKDPRPWCAASRMPVEARQLADRLQNCYMAIDWVAQKFRMSEGRVLAATKLDFVAGLDKLNKSAVEQQVFRGKLDSAIAMKIHELAAASLQELERLRVAFPAQANRPDLVTAEKVCTGLERDSLTLAEMLSEPGPGSEELKAHLALLGVQAGFLTAGHADALVVAAPKHEDGRIFDCAGVQRELCPVDEGAAAREPDAPARMTRQMLLAVWKHAPALKALSHELYPDGTGLRGVRLPHAEDPGDAFSMVDAAREAGINEVELSWQGSMDLRQLKPGAPLTIRMNFADNPGLGGAFHLPASPLVHLDFVAPGIRVLQERPDGLPPLAYTAGSKPPEPHAMRR